MPSLGGAVAVDHCGRCKVTAQTVGVTAQKSARNSRMGQSPRAQFGGCGDFAPRPCGLVPTHKLTTPCRLLFIWATEISSPTMQVTNQYANFVYKI